MPMADLKSAIWEASAGDPFQILLTISIFLTMISIVSLCTCCFGSKNQTKNQDDCDYGVVTVTQAGNAPKIPQPIHTINFRESNGKNNQNRHSQPSTNMKVLTSNRQSAPGRALPKLPGDLYTIIDKKPKNDETRFAYETINPMYECIDVETDSFVDPLYSKVGVPITSAKDRRYDYPIFSGRQNNPKPVNDDVLYQSASQVYAAGSEDPYSSISERDKIATFMDGDGDTSSAYDPGYAKVQTTGKENHVEQSKNKKDKTDRELDLLYSKIRRNVSNYSDENQAGPSRVEPIIQSYPRAEPLVSVISFDEQSAISSREPSYRYITMRENAEIVRERLRQQGQLDRPTREHYYSTIGNEYETINNTQLNLRDVVLNQSVPQAPLADLDTITSMDAPPPPTSPIPERSRPVSYIDEPHIYSGILKPPPNIPPPPDLRCSPVPPRPMEEQVYSINKLKNFNEKSVQDPKATYRNSETLVGKRTVEEKETIIEHRSSYTSGISVPTTSENLTRMISSVENLSSKPIHEVKIRRLESKYDGDGPTADVIISGRRYRSEQGTSSDSTKPCLNKSAENVSASAPQVENDEKVDVKVQEASTNKASTKKSGKKEETEEEKIQRLGTVYTANDYICHLDMTDERPWPIKNFK